MRKSGGTAEGAAFVGWNGTYSFNATGRRIPLESVKAMAYPQAPLTGLLEFNADGTGTFEVPRYQFRGRIRDLFVADEGVGEVTGRVDVRGDSMTIEIEAASPRLAVSGTGRIDLTETQDADITLRFTDTSLDPYARAFEKRFSPFTTAVGSGTLRVIGELANPDRLVVDVMFDQLQIRTFDYPLRNAQADSRADAQQRRADRRHAVRRRWHRARRDGHDGSERPPGRRPRARNREPRHPAGLLPQHPQLGQRAADRAGQRLARRADHPRARDDRQRTPALLLAAALARSGERHHPVRLAQYQARRPDGARGGRPGDLRRPHRPRRLRAGRSRR